MSSQAPQPAEGPAPSVRRFARVRTRRFAAWAAIGAAAALALVLTALGSVGWYYANELRDDALELRHDPPSYNLVVTAVGPGEVALENVSAGEDNPWDREGTWGLEWSGGYGQVSDILGSEGTGVRRHFTLIEGELQPGTAARIDDRAFPGDPLRAFGYPFEEVEFQSELGPLEAWFVAGESRQWLVFVHGRNGHPAEGLRVLPAAHSRGMSALLITYRGDVGAPVDPDRFHHYGATEWRDLDSAVAYALAHGATSVMLAGESMGGGIVMSFMIHSDLRAAVAGLILDSPMLDFNASVDFQARDRGVPRLITWLGKKVAGVRFDIDWDELDYLRRSSGLTVPVLLFHGTADPTVPVATSDRLAASRPDLVTYVRVEGALHARSWNSDPERYMGAVEAWLTDVLSAAAAPIAPEVDG